MPKSLFNEVACLRPATFLKKRLVFLCEFSEISKNTFSYSTLLVATSAVTIEIFRKKVRSKSSFLVKT